MARILVVDDNTEVLNICKRFLETKRHKVDVAQGPLEALGYLETQTVDLIISDVMMPDLGGFAFVDRLQSMQHTRDIPVIMISSSSDEATIKEATVRSIKDFVVKPLMIAPLNEKVEKCLIKRDDITEFRLNEYKFQGQAKGSILAPITLLSISEDGIEFLWSNRLDKKSCVQMKSDIFKIIGFEPPIIMIEAVEPTANGKWKVKGSFQNITDQTRKTIRNWMLNATLEQRK